MQIKERKLERTGRRRTKTQKQQKQNYDYSPRSVYNSSTSSTISTASTRLIVAKLKTQSLRESTRRQYYGAWKKFNPFFVRLDGKPNTWEDRLVLFTGYLVEEKIKSTTIKCYISGIKAILKEDGYELDMDQCAVKSLTRACKLKYDQVRVRLPIQIGLLILLNRQIEIKFGGTQPYLNILYQALFTTTYFGMFRVGELTSGTHPVMVKDVHIADNKKKMTFVLRTSKTHGTGDKRQIIKITSGEFQDSQADSSNNSINLYFRENDEVCPHQIVSRFMDIRPVFEDATEPFFVFRDLSPVHTRAF